MVACSACGAQPAYRPTYTKLAYCQEHFLALIEKRVRKDLRLSQPVDLQQAYHVLDDGSPAAALLKRLLDRIFSDRLQVDDQAKRVRTSLFGRGCLCAVFLIPGEEAVADSCSKAA